MYNIQQHWAGLFNSFNQGSSLSQGSIFVTSPCLSEDQIKNFIWHSFLFLYIKFFTITAKARNMGWSKLESLILKSDNTFWYYERERNNIMFWKFTRLQTISLNYKSSLGLEIFYDFVFKTSGNLYDKLVIVQSHVPSIPKNQDQAFFPHICWAPGYPTKISAVSLTFTFP